MQHACVKVVGFYEDLPAGLRISRVCAHLREEFAAAVHFEVIIYSFQVLLLPGVALAAARKAEKAEALIVSAHERATIPRRLRKWIGRLHLAPQAQVLELGAEAAENSPVYEQLRALAVTMPRIQTSSTAFTDPLLTRNESDQNGMEVHAIDEQELIDAVHFGIND